MEVLCLHTEVLISALLSLSTEPNEVPACSSKDIVLLINENAFLEALTKLYEVLCRSAQADEVRVAVYISTQYEWKSPAQTRYQLP